MSQRPDQPEPLKPHEEAGTPGARNGAPGAFGPVSLPEGISEEDVLAFVEDDADEAQLARVNEAMTRHAEFAHLLKNMREDREQLRAFGPTSQTKTGYDGAGLAAGLLGTARQEKPDAKRAGRPDSPMPLEPVMAEEGSLIARHSGEIGPANERQALEIEFDDSIPFNGPKPGEKRSRIPLWSGLAAAVVGLAGVGLVVYAMLPALQRQTGEEIAGTTPAEEEGEQQAADQGMIDEQPPAAIEHSERADSVQPDDDTPDPDTTEPEPQRLATEDRPEPRWGWEIDDEQPLEADPDGTYALADEDGDAADLPKAKPGNTQAEPAPSLSDEEAARAARDGRLVIMIEVDEQGARAVRSLAVESIMGGRSYSVAGPLPSEYREALIAGLQREPDDDPIAYEPPLDSEIEHHEDTDSYSVTVRSTPQAIRSVGRAIERATKGKVRFARSPIELSEMTPRGQMNVWTEPTSAPSGRVSSALIVRKVR